MMHTNGFLIKTFDLLLGYRLVNTPAKLSQAMGVLGQETAYDQSKSILLDIMVGN